MYLNVFRYDNKLKLIENIVKKTFKMYVVKVIFVSFYF